MDNEHFGKYLSYILRHNPQKIGVNMCENGWVSVDELVYKINQNNSEQIDISVLYEIVENNNKKRYSFNSDKTKIRANQGHSIHVDVELKEITPPNTLYHGTATKYEGSIDKDGLIAKTRLYVHLSENIETALNVGKRHGTPLIYEIDCKSMVDENNIFYLSENNVWLTKYVPSRFLSKKQL
ncbi:MAG: RNA 2'-phosphotransferase [Eubacteriales bacterium]